MLFKTKYHGPTNYNGSRIKVTSVRGKLDGKLYSFHEYDDAYSAPANHLRALEAHVLAMGIRDNPSVYRIDCGDHYLWLVAEVPSRI